MKTCTSIFTPRNQTFYDLVFEPSIIVRNKGKFLGFLEQSINSNHKLQANNTHMVLDALILSPEALTNPFMFFEHTQNINSIKDFSFISTFDKSLQALIISTCFRVFQILSVSLLHRIAISRRDKASKFILTAATSILPIYAMYFLGYSSIELGMLSLLVSLSPYVLNNDWSNRIREVDLISTTKEFILQNCLINNCLSYTRSIISILLLEAGIRLFYSILYATSNNALFTSLLEDEVANHYDIEICSFLFSSNPPYGHSVLTPAHWLSQLLLVNLGWGFGRLVIDLGIGVLNELNIIPDARDLFYNQTFKKSSTNLQTPTSTEPVEMRSSANQTKKRAIAPVTYSEYAPVKLQDKVIRGKKIKPEQQAGHDSAPPAAASKSIERSVVEIPDYPLQSLVPFFPAPQSAATYGVVANSKACHSNKFATTLSNASNTVAYSKGSIECLDTANQVFSIRPKNLDNRLVGKKVAGNDKAVEVLKRLFGYERAWEAAEKMRGDMDVLSVVPFTKETNHARLSDTVASFGRS